MTLDVDALHTAVRGWVAALTGLPLTAVLFENVPRPQVPVCAYLSWVSLLPAGATDERRLIVDTGVAVPGLNATPATVTRRTCALQIGIEAYTQTATAGAMALLEKLRGKKNGTASRALLKAANLGLVRMTATLTGDYKVDQRWISRFLATVTFNQCDVTADATEPTTSTIETVEVSSTLANTGGTTLPDAMQWTDHVIDGIDPLP